MMALANTGLTDGCLSGAYLRLRAMGQSRIEKMLQVPEVQGLVGCLSDITERAGFEPAVEAFTPTTV